MGEPRSIGQVLVDLRVELDRDPSGVSLIARERARQIVTEGWTPEHDDQHADGALVTAAVCYLSLSAYPPGNPPSEFPWPDSWWKPTPDDRVRELVKAGALIAAEIDRHLRAARPTGDPT